MFKIIISLTVTKVLFKIWNRPAADDSPLALPNVWGCVLVCELNMYTDIRHWNRIPTRTAILSRLVHSSHIHTINHHHRSPSTRPKTETQSCDISPLAMILFSCGGWYSIIIIIKRQPRRRSWAWPFRPSWPVSAASSLSGAPAAGRSSWRASTRASASTCRTGTDSGKEEKEEQI